MKYPVIIFFSLLVYHSYGQLYYGPVVSLSADLPAMETSDISGTGIVEINDKAVLMPGIGAMIGNQFESNFMIQLQSIINLKTKYGLKTGNTVHELEYQKFITDLLIGYKVNYNIRLLTGIGINVPLLDEEDINLLNEFLNSQYPDTFDWTIIDNDKEIMGSILFGVDYSTPKFILAVHYRLVIDDPILDIGSYSQGGYEITNPNLGVTFAFNLNK